MALGVHLAHVVMYLYITALKDSFHKVNSASDILEINLLFIVTLILEAVHYYVSNGHFMCENDKYFVYCCRAFPCKIYK